MFLGGLWVAKVGFQRLKVVIEGNKPKISPRYAKDMPKIYQRYTKDIPKISKIYIVNICQKFWKI